jgi:hypothetical protein
MKFIKDIAGIAVAAGIVLALQEAIGMLANLP